jgi:hypothetical protein
MTFDSCFALGLLFPGLLYGQDNDFPKRRDFSKTNSVTISLGDLERKGRLPGNGLEHAFWEPDGFTMSTNIQEVACRCLVPDEARTKAYFYFTIDDTFKRQDISKVKIDVEYFDGFDGHAGVFGLQYDASGKGGLNSRFKPLLPVVPLNGSKKWLKATFRVPDGTFHNGQNGNSDFRLWVTPAELCVSRVTVTLDPKQEPEKPLAFNPAGEATLGDWNIQWGDSVGKPAFARQATNAPRSLEIRAPGKPIVASWRTSAFLPAGDYQFVGKARTEGLAADTREAAGVTLRLSYQGGSRIVSAPEWTTLTYDFSLSTPERVEFICEFHGARGIARFDVDSLKLIRKK